MVYLLALAIFVGLSAACWFVSASLCHSTLGDPSPAASPDHDGTATAAIGLAALASFVPFPFGYAAGLVVWAVAAFGGLGLGADRATVLFGYLAATSLVARLVVLGVMSAIGG
jgi:hypothetical protein